LFSLAKKVRVKLDGLQKYQRILRDDLAGTGNGPIRAAFKQWAARYRAFLQERFASYSRGGGDWPDLAESTKRQRRKGKGKSGVVVFAILRNFGYLFAALTPNFTGRPGALQQNIPYGIRVGFGGPGKHPKGNATIADIASFHQQGGKFLPVRQIIVDPPEQVIFAMRGDMQNALIKLADETKIHFFG